MGFALKGKEIIEYYLRQLEEEGVTFVPRWTPRSVAPPSETAVSGRKQVAALAVVVPDAAQKEGLGSEALSSPSGAPEPVVGTPDGGFLTVPVPLSAVSSGRCSYTETRSQRRPSSCS